MFLMNKLMRSNNSTIRRWLNALMQPTMNRRISKKQSKKKNNKFESKMKEYEWEHTQHTRTWVRPHLTTYYNSASWHWTFFVVCFGSFWIVYHTENDLWSWLPIPRFYFFSFQSHSNVFDSSHHNVSGHRFISHISRCLPLCYPPNRFNTKN